MLYDCFYYGSCDRISGLVETNQKLNSVGQVKFFDNADNFLLVLLDNVV